MRKEPIVVPGLQRRLPWLEAAPLELRDPERKELERALMELVVEAARRVMEGRENE